MGMLDTVHRLQAGLDYHLERHNLLTANLAHIDTPGFRPLDLARNDGGANGAGFDQAMQLALATTNEGHIGSSGGTEEVPHDFSVIQDPTATPGLDGNAVSIDREAVKIATNQLRYDTLSVLASGELSGLDWAARDGSTG